MKTNLSNVYLMPAILLCFHLVFTVSGFFFYVKFEDDLASRTAEYNAMKPRLRQINETQLNKDMVFEVMTANQQDSETFATLFKSLAIIGFGMSCLSVASLLNIYRSQAALK